MKETSRFVVGPLAELPPGACKLVPVGKFGVGIFNIHGQLYALTNYCPHRGGPLCLGGLHGVAEPGERPWEISWIRDGEILRCPWHQWEFDVATGSALAHEGTARPYSIRMYPVKVEDETVILEGV